MTASPDQSGSCPCPNIVRVGSLLTSIDWSVLHPAKTIANASTIADIPKIFLFTIVFSPLLWQQSFVMRLIL
jgi:hypothetical protein